jgi:hypothetical protein
MDLLAPVFSPSPLVYEMYQFESSNLVLEEIE